MKKNSVNPFDLLSGKAVKNQIGTFWFKDAGVNIDSKGKIIEANLHRDDDLPAVVGRNGTKQWYKNGLLHRDNDLPAVVNADGSAFWYRLGLRHRDNDKPAMMFATEGGQVYYYKNNESYIPAGMTADLHRGVVKITYI